MKHQEQRDLTDLCDGAMCRDLTQTEVLYDDRELIDGEGREEPVGAEILNGVSGVVLHASLSVC